MCLSEKRTLQNILLIVVCGLKSFQTSVVAAENSLLPILGNNQAIAPYQEFSLLNNAINTPKVLAGLGQKKRQPEIVQQLVQLANQWLNPAGQIEATLADSISGTGSHWGQVNVLLPVRSTADQLLLLQGGAQCQYDRQEINLGVGQRWFTAKAAYWGYNLFYDQLYHSNHRRLGLGIEQHSGYRTLCLNAYLPLSRWQLVDNGNNRQRPAFGFDLRWQQTLSRYPECCWRVVGEHYFADQLAANGLPNKQPAKTAVSIGIEYTPVSLLNLGYSYQLAKGRQGAHQFQLSLVYRLGVPFSQQLQSVRELRESSDSYRLALVQREKSIKLQQVAINRNQKSPLPFPISTFDKTDEQADDEPPNPQSTLESKDQSGDQPAEGTQSAPAASSKETSADDATSVALPGMVSQGRGHTPLEPVELSSGSPQCGSGEDPSLEINLSANLSKFPGLVPGNPLPKGRAGVKKPGYPKSFNVKAAPHKATTLLNLREQMDVQEENAKENSAPFQPPTADPSLKVDRSSIDSCSTQATNPPALSLELESLESSQEERLVNSESDSLNKITPRTCEGSMPTFVTPPKEREIKESIPPANFSTFPKEAPSIPFDGAEGEQRIDAFELFAASDVSNHDFLKTSTDGASFPAVNPSDALLRHSTATASLEDKRLSTATCSTRPSSVQVELEEPPSTLSLERESSENGFFNEIIPRSGRKVTPTGESICTPTNLLHQANHPPSKRSVADFPLTSIAKETDKVQPKIRNSFGTPTFGNNASASNVNLLSGTPDTSNFNLGAPPSSTAGRRRIDPSESSGRLPLNALKFSHDVDLSLKHSKKVSKAQQIKEKRNVKSAHFFLQQKKLEDKKLAVEAKEQALNAAESELQQKQAKFAADKRGLQTQQEELKAKELAVEAKEQALNNFKSELQQAQASIEAAQEKQKISEDQLANGWNGLKAEKKAAAEKDQEIHIREENLQQNEKKLDIRTRKVSLQEKNLRNDYEYFDERAEDQKQTAAQLAADKRWIRSQREELEADKHAVEPVNQQLHARKNQLDDKERIIQIIKQDLTTAQKEKRKLEAYYKDKYYSEVVKQAKKTTYINQRGRLAVKQKGLSSIKNKLLHKETQCAVDESDLQLQQAVNPGEGSLSIRKLSRTVDADIQQANLQPLEQSGQVNIESSILVPSGETTERKRVRDLDAFERPQHEVKKKKGTLNEEENDSMPEISSEPSASTDTGNVADIQAQQESQPQQEINNGAGNTSTPELIGDVSVSGRIRGAVDAGTQRVNSQPEVNIGSSSHDGRNSESDAEGSCSMSRISSREPLASTDTGNATDTQTQQQSTGTSSGENQESSQVVDESAAPSPITSENGIASKNPNKPILKINQFTRPEMEEFSEKNKGKQFSTQSIKKIFEKRDQGVFIENETHLRLVVGGQSSKILQRIEIDYTH